MWIVYDNEEGLLGVYDNYDEALSDYEKCKESQRDYVQSKGEFTDEKVILAEVKRHFYGYETDKKAVEFDKKNGKEFETKDNLWDWREDIY